MPSIFSVFLTLEKILREAFILILSYWVRVEFFVLCNGESTAEFLMCLGIVIDLKLLQLESWGLNG